MHQNVEKQGTVLRLPDEFVWPDYESGSVANVPGTVAAMLDVPLTGLPPLREALWRPLAGGVRRVVLFIVDAWGWNLFLQEQARLERVLRQTAITAQVTSIFPSTTVAALSTLWTGVAPAQHGMVGFRMFLPEYGVIGQMIHFTPAFGWYPDSLVHAGLEPEIFLNSPGFAEQLAAAGVPTYAYKGRDIVGSNLSKMHGRGVTGNYGVTTLAEMFVRMRALLEEKVGQPMYVCAYWPSIDALSHLYGWDHAVVAAEIRTIMMQLADELLEPLSLPARKDTALFILADHGQVVTPIQQQIYLEDHPALRQMMLMHPAGEPRAAYLFARQGHQQDIIDYINSELGHAMVAVSTSEALAAGLLGPMPYAPQTESRIGDVIVIMRQGYSLLTAREQDKEKADTLPGRHASLTAAEMLVPWLGFRLDG